MKVIDLRNYQLEPGRRDDFIRFFEENFLEALGRHGMPVLGQFEVVGQPDRFVFIRVFPDMVARLRSLHAFYDGAYWLERRATVNSMLVDSDHVHLLKPLGDVARLAGSRSHGLLAVDLHRLPAGGVGRAVETFDHDAPGVFGTFVSELTPNDFPRHPVIQDPDLFAVIADGTRERPRLEGAETKTVLLKPTARSRMR